MQNAGLRATRNAPAPTWSPYSQNAAPLVDCQIEMFAWGAMASLAVAMRKYQATTNLRHNRLTQA